MSSRPSSRRRLPAQVVLLERTRNGSVYLSAPSFDLADPLGSDAGIAESGAMVTLTTPSGQTLVAREDKASRNDGTGAGVYRFTLPGNSLVRNGAYHLAVRTTDGALLAADTSVPGGTTADVAAPRVFIPGFPQAITVSAVDSNYYDWLHGVRAARIREEQPSRAGIPEGLVVVRQR